MFALALRALNGEQSSEQAFASAIEVLPLLVAVHLAATCPGVPAAAVPNWTRSHEKASVLAPTLYEDMAQSSLNFCRPEKGLPSVVIPAQASIQQQSRFKPLDPGLRRGDIQTKSGLIDQATVMA